MIELAVGLRRFGGLVADVYVHGDLHTSTPTRIADALAAEDEVPPEACWVLPSTLLEEGCGTPPGAAVCFPHRHRTGGLLSKCCEFYTCALGRKRKILRCHFRGAAKEINLLHFVLG